MKLSFKKPPALNHLYINSRWGGKILSQRGREWQEEALWSLKNIKYQTIDTPCSLTVHLYTCRHQDNDSVLKILQDTLQKAGVIKDDYLIFELHVYKHKCLAKEERVGIEVFSL